jgi:hypothetical protein
MDRLQDMLEYAEKLNNSTTIEECTCIIKDLNKKDDIDYNLNITVFVMHLNKILKMKIDCITEEDDKKYPEIITKLTEEMNIYCDDIINEIQKEIENVEIQDKDVYIQYLKRVSKFCILKAFEYQTEVEEYNEWNTNYRREERARDYMKQLIEKNKYVDLYKFTNKYHIEVPFMYIFIWDIRSMGYDYAKGKFYSLYDDKNKKADGSYYSVLRVNLKYYLKNLSKEFVQIIFNGVLYDEINRRRKGIAFPKKIEFHSLLPTFISDEKDYSNYATDSLVEGYWKNKADSSMPFVRKEIYRSIPLVPTRLVEKRIPIIALKLMSDVFIQESQTDKLNDVFKRLTEKLNLNRGDDPNKDISAEEFDKMANNIDSFLRENKMLILKSSIYDDESEYDDKYGKRLNKLIDYYKNDLNPGTISDIEASRDLSSVAPEKMDLILMPIFRSIEQEIRTKIFDIFFDKFKGLHCVKVGKRTNTTYNFENRNIMLGNITYYDKEFLESSNKNTLSFYFKKLIKYAGCDKDYYEMIEVLKEDEINKLSFAKMRNAIAHRNEAEISKFSDDILNEVMDVLVEAPGQLIRYIITINKRITEFLSEVNIVPLKNSIVRLIPLDNNKYCFELNGFLYNCTKPDKLNEDVVIDGYDTNNEIWIVK